MSGTGASTPESGERRVAVNALLIIGCTAGGMLLGAAAGFGLGVATSKDDFDFGPLIYAIYGAVIGGFVGVVVGAAVFA